MKYIFTIILSCVGVMAFSQASLIKDINVGAEDGIPDWAEENAILGNAMIFAANDGTIGSELYKLENGQVSLIKDILPGAEGSTPEEFITYKNLVYFSAQNATGTYDIYTTDGSAANTKVAITIGNSNSVYKFFISNNGKLYFNMGNSLYVSEGTTSTTQKIDTKGTVNFDNSWTYASTNIVNYKNGVAFHGYKDKTYYIFYHDGAKLDTLTKFTAGSFSSILGPVNTQNGLVYGVQDSFDDNLIGLFKIDGQTNAVTEILINNTSVDISRLYEVNGSYCILKPLGGGIYSYNGTSVIQLTTGGSNFTLYQGEELSHAVIGNQVFFFGLSDWFDKQYYISDGTASGTVAVETPERAYAGRNLITEGNFAYMFQGVTNGFTAALVKIDFTTKTSEVIYSSGQESTTESEFEIMNILDGKMYFVAQLSDAVGRELYVVEPPKGLLFPTSGTKNIVSCDTTIFDDGGVDGNYSSSVSGTLVLAPSLANSAISIEFISFDIEKPYDKFIVTNADKVTTLNGSTLPNNIISTAADGKLTLKFTSDFMTEKSGFEIKVGCATVTGISDNTYAKNSIYPNPSNGIVYFEMQGSGTKKISVNDILGKEVLNTLVSELENKVDLSSLENGYYDITITSGDKVLSEKVLINK